MPGLLPHPVQAAADHSLVLASGIDFSRVAGLDQAVYAWFLDHRSTGWTVFFTIVTWPFLPGIAVAVAVVTRAMPVAVLLAAITTSLLKKIIARPRPPLEDMITPEHNFSFPSGHATASMALTLAWLIVYRRWWLMVIPLIVGASRLYLGVHWLSDVLAGWVVAALAVAIVYYLSPIVVSYFPHIKDSYLRTSRKET